jgi:hypothetical protein
MRIAVNAFAFWAVAAALHSALLVAPAGAQEAAPEPRPERAARAGADRWVPSFAVVGGVTVQNWKATTLGTLYPAPTMANPNPTPVSVRPPQLGKDRDVTPFVGGNLELMTPELPLPTSPRLFVGGELLPSFGTDRKVALEGDPGMIGNPIPEASRGLTSYGEDAVLGQGSELVASLDTLVYGAHAGVAFPFELYGRALRIKPSFAWMRYGVHVEGQIVDAQCRPLVVARQGCDPALGGFLREVRLEAKGSKTFDAIGGGLDLEMDTWRWGPVGTSLFTSARIYKVLGDRTIELEAPSRSFNDVLGMARATGRFSFEVDPWMYRVGIGLRFQWLGSSAAADSPD